MAIHYNNHSSFFNPGSGGDEDEADLMPPPPRQKKRINQNVTQSKSSAPISKSIMAGRADIRVRLSPLSNSVCMISLLIQSVGFTVAEDV